MDKKVTVECGFRPERTKDQPAPPAEPDCSFKAATVLPLKGEEPAAVVEESQDDAPVSKTGKRK